MATNYSAPLNTKFNINQSVARGPWVANRQDAHNRMLKIQQRALISTRVWTVSGYVNREGIAMLLYGMRIYTPVMNRTFKTLPFNEVSARVYDSRGTEWNIREPLRMSSKCACSSAHFWLQQGHSDLFSRTTQWQFLLIKGNSAVTTVRLL